MMMDETDRPSSPDSAVFHQRQQHRPLTQRNSGSSSSGKRQKRQQQQQRYRGQAEEDQDTERDSNMPLAVPKAAFTVLDRFMAPETQTRVVNWGVNFAAERPWMSSFFAVVALFAVLPLLGLVLALVLLLGFVLFWLSVVLFVFAGALTVTSLFAAGAWMYCLVLVLSTRKVMGFFSGSISSSSTRGSITSGSSKRRTNSPPKQKQQSSGDEKPVHLGPGPGGDDSTPSFADVAKKPPSGDEQHQRKTGGSSNADSDMGWQRDMEYDNDSVRDDDERLREGLKNGGGGGGHGGMPDEREKMRSDIEKSLR